MDVVYILGTGTVWQNNEIRYSLRSVEKNILDLDQVFVVGECPDWLTNVVHISCGDPSPIRWENAYYKVVTACAQSSLSEEFLFMNDDFIIFRPIVASIYPYYYKMFRRKSGENAVDYTVHRPVRFKKKLYLNMPLPANISHSFSPRSFYCNYYNVKGVLCEELLFSPYQPAEYYDRLLGERTDMALASATGKYPVFQQWIKNKFPVPSRFEKQAL